MNTDQIKCQTYSLDSLNVSKLIKNSSVRKTLFSNQFWHKITLQNAGNISKIEKLNKIEKILYTITKLAQPYLLIPVNFKKVRNCDIQFICKNCGEAIEQICRQSNLKIKEGNKIIRVSIVLGFSKITDIQFDISKIFVDVYIVNLFDSETKTLNLASFGKRKSRGCLFFCNLSIPAGLYLILSLCKHLQPKVLKLGRNGIQCLEEGIQKFIPTVEIIDLKLNRIASLNDISSLKSLNLKEITLNGNPVCDECDNGINYILTIKTMFPNLEVIDSISIDSLVTSIPRIPSYIHSKSAEFLIDQFLDNYFPIYDSKIRKNLHALYHPNALFSLSSSIGNAEESTEPGVKMFDNSAHNLLKWNKSDFDVGPDSIMKKLCYFPSTEHDPCSFCVDVLQYIENVSVTFVINGVFRERKKRPVLYNFTRTFMLLRIENGEYNIINDMLHVANDTENAIRKFEFTKGAAKKKNFKVSLPPAFSANEKQQFIESFSELTTLLDEYATGYLELANWDFKLALENFVYNCRFDMVPKIYFKRCPYMQLKDAQEDDEDDS